jgi:1,4-alpha-glucan branching enzyme
MLLVHEDNKQLVYRRGPLVFVFNFHWSNSYSDWRIPVPDPSDYQMILNTDSMQFGGHGLARDDTKFIWQPVPAGQWKQSMMIYVPARSAQVFAPVGHRISP